MIGPLRQRVSEVLAHEIGCPVERVERALRPPRDARHGDLALGCFEFAKERGVPPVELARRLAATTPPEGVQAFSAAGPFLNVRFEPGALAREVVSAVLSTEGRFGASDEGAGKTVCIDFSSPNIAKPFGIHHLRSTVIGAAIARILEFRGYGVVRINHLGDWGTQFGQLIVAYRAWGEGERLEREGIPYLLELYVRFNRELEHRPQLLDEARAAFRALEEGDPDARALWRRFREVSLAEFRRVYERLGVEFDEYTGESFYEDRMPEVLARLERAGLLRESDEATIVDLEDEGLGVCVVKKRDDASLYVTRDLAAAYYRWETYRFHRALYVVGAAQSLHFKQLFRILEKLGEPFADRMVHVPFGLLRFRDRKMSTRKGDILLLEEVLDRAHRLALEIVSEKNPDLPDKERVAEQVAMAAVVFNDLRLRRIKDVVFDWDEVLSFEGDTGPYLQYTHARCSNILKKAGVGEDELDAQAAAALELDVEQDVVRRLAAFPEAVERAAAEYEPSVVSQCLLSLAAEFNRFYNDPRCRVVGAAGELRRGRLALVGAVRAVLATGLGLLGIAAPDEM